MHQRVEIPLIGPSYENREKKLSAQKSINMWPEINPEARNQVSLHNCAGLRTAAQLEGKDRGLHVFNGLLYAVNGGYLYSIDDEGTSIQLGAIVGTDRCIMASSPYRLVIVSGNTPYQYTLSSGVEIITDENLVNPTWVAFLNSQFIFDNNNGTWGEFVVAADSGEDTLTVDPLDFATAESHPDDVTRGVAYRQLMYFFGTNSVEPWQNTGTGNPPFARMNSGVKPYSLAGTHAICVTDDYMYFLDAKRKPRRTNGLDYPHIGTPALGVEFAKYSKIDDCIVFEFTQDNQQFVAFTFPTANRTWCFHEPSGSWFQMTSGMGNDRHRASSMIQAYGLNYCADHTNGKIYEYSLDQYTDDGDVIVKQRDTADIHGGLYGVPGKRLTFNEVEFVIASGSTEVAGLGLGAQPVTSDVGVCGTAGDLTQGDLLAPSYFMMANNATEELVAGDPVAGGWALDNTKVVSFTCAFTRSSLPAAGTWVHAMDFYSTQSSTSYFEFAVDENGFMNIRGRNSSGTVILQVQITNNGGSFADGAFYLFSVVINLDDESKREIYINNVDRTEGAWVTWTTYTDDEIYLDGTVGGPPAYIVYYGFGKTQKTNIGWGDDNNEDATLGFLTFDNNCSLICSALWDNDGWIRDPGKWEGWYKSQPQIAFLTSFYRNTGVTGPTTLAESEAGTAFENDFDGIATGSPNSATIYTNDNPTSMIYNYGIGANHSATDRDTLPDAPAADPPAELVEPFWDNTGSFIDLAKTSQTTFETMFTVPVEGADFNKAVTVSDFDNGLRARAALVNTSNSGNRLQLRDSVLCANAWLGVVRSDGTIVDSMIYSGVPNGDSVLIPTGSDYYVVTDSDSGLATIKKWDSIVPSTGGATSFESIFGFKFGIGGDVQYKIVSVWVPSGGLSVWFDVPATSDEVLCGFFSVQNTSTNSQRFGSISETAGDFTGLINNTLGNAGGQSVGATINTTRAGYPELTPGNRYFFNIRFVTGEANWANINYSYSVQS